MQKHQAMAGWLIVNTKKGMNARSLAIWSLWLLADMRQIDQTLKQLKPAF